MLAAVFRHRFLAARHIRQLHFHGTNVRALQVRLRRLWEARFLDRLYLPPEMPDQRDRWTEVPLYSLDKRGAELVAADLGIDIARISHTRAQNRRGFFRTRHNLAATDLLVAVEAFCARSPLITATTTREDVLAGLLLRARRVRRIPYGLVPDGAVTLTMPNVKAPQTYLIEIVRAGVKAGNDTIRKRLHRYRAALRTGFFRDVYGFAWVRTIVFLTPTWRRAETLSQLARDVPGGDGLFRFGAYEAKAAEPLPTAHFPGETTPPFPVLTPQAVRVPLFPELSITSPQPHV